MSITIKDVASMAGVSVTTVSRALNHRGYISKETQDKIEAAIHELNYSPNQLARSLFQAKTNTVGLVVPSIAHPFFAQMTELIEQKLYRLGYHVLLCTTESNRDRESDILTILRQHRMDGIIMASPQLPSAEYERVGIPIVAFDTLLDSANVSVEADHLLGGRMAADVLIRSGCRYAVQIIGNPEARTDAAKRHRVFMDRMMESGCPCVSIPVTQEFFKLDKYESIAEQILQDHKDADAFFATDLFALAIERCALRKGLRIPDDIQIVGYDGTYVAEASYPRLTVVRQPFESLAANVVESIIHLIDGIDTEQRIVLDNLELIRGQTTRQQEAE